MAGECVGGDFSNARGITTGCSSFPSLFADARSRVSFKNATWVDNMLQDAKLKVLEESLRRSISSGALQGGVPSYLEEVALSRND